ncbi:NAD(+) diphosphatase [Hyphococcus sp. DH-69]|uniref:NAD(+) diphosphatase n=1 Tax=Hyphococcus formosus TaxID=3143534 RepID=UPI00398AEAD6
MEIAANPNWFANNPLARLNNEKDNEAFIRDRLADADSLMIPLWRGDPLVIGGKDAGFLSAAARREFPQSAPTVFLGLKDNRAYFGIDASATGQTPEAAAFSDIGQYMPLREAASVVSREDLSIIGHARWLIEWRRTHRFCSACGHETALELGGAKSQCPNCEAVHFPRSNPVAIVLATHDDACLLGRGPGWPPGFLSALAGFIEAGETPEEAARREIFEEAGVTLTDVRYQFSQPWPFPASMMMGFIADATGRDLNLDTNEIEEACWVAKSDIRLLLAKDENAPEGIFVPPRFTIARQLLEVWAR